MAQGHDLKALATNGPPIYATGLTLFSKKAKYYI